MKLMKKTTAILLIIEIILSLLNFIFVSKEVNAATLSSSYTQYVKEGIDAFPESYKPYLEELQELHPNWKFKAYYTGIDWSELTSSVAENKCKKNTIYFKNSVTVMDPEGLCKCGKEGDPNYYCASATTVNYYIDPRNFLDETMIFQFLELSYDKNITDEIVIAAAKSSFLSGTFVVDEVEYKYTDVIMEAAEESKVSAMHIVATIIQELGRGEKQEDGTYSIPKAASGTVKGYEGLYNFFNYGATDSSNGEGGAIERGLVKAEKLGWTNPIIAIKDGVQRVLASNYISKGQNTKYFYKFDVVGNEILQPDDGKKKYDSSYFFSHQYMTNIQDPSSQATTLFTNYNNSGLSGNDLTFVIPVYNNMPDIPSMKGTSLTPEDGTLYKVKANISVTVRKGAGTSYASLGSISRDSIVAYNGKSGNWYKVKIVKATSYDSTNKKWKSSTITGYIHKDYLEKCNITPNLEVDEDNATILVAPGATVKIVTNVYSEAKITNKEEKDITTEVDTVHSTGNKVIIGEKEYKIVVLGDVNGDGRVSSSDLLAIVKHLNETTILENEYKTACDANKDGKISSSDLLTVVKHLNETTKITV